jgi:hypothetical protein
MCLASASTTSAWRSALTLAGTRAVAPGKSDADLPGHDKATMKHPFTRPVSD